eukprot:GILJ01011703.1.p3 GENE.GILJ01011703.1~~GILJ01011703.1.p3  ORF type:complete len:106 (-),score=15.91 GILJ01011703.1:256-573(-)
MQSDGRVVLGFSKVRLISNEDPLTEDQHREILQNLLPRKIVAVFTRDGMGNIEDGLRIDYNGQSIVFFKKNRRQIKAKFEDVAANEIAKDRASEILSDMCKTHRI